MVARCTERVNTLCDPPFMDQCVAQPQRRLFGCCSFALRGERTTSIKESTLLPQAIATSGEVNSPGRLDRVSERPAVPRSALNRSALCYKKHLSHEVADVLALL